MTRKSAFTEISEVGLSYRASVQGGRINWLGSSYGNPTVSTFVSKVAEAGVIHGVL